MWRGGVVGFVLRAAALVLYTAIRSVWALLPWRTREELLWESQRWGRRILRLCGVRLLVEGTAPVGSPVIYVCNHASLLDIPVLLAVLPPGLCFLYKEELQRIPLFGWVLRRMPYVPIARGQSLAAWRQLQQAAQQLQQYGLSPVVFPEGERTPDGQLRAFRRGAFVLAAMVGHPVVPVAIAGTYRLLPRHRLRFLPGTVRVRIGEPLPPPPMERKEQQGYQERVRMLLQRWLVELSEGLDSWAHARMPASWSSESPN